MNKFNSNASSTIRTDRVAERFEEADHSYITGADGWFLEVVGDGTKVRYRNMAHIEQLHIQPIPVEQRFQNEQLYLMGLHFIETQLSEFLPVNNSGEKIVPYFSQYEIMGSSEAIGQSNYRVEYVNLSVIVFTRSLDSHNVVGPGSKIAIFFANDGSPVGFDFDWTEFRKNEAQARVLQKNKIIERFNMSGNFPLTASSVELTGIECGYVDLGVKHKSITAPLQPGCMFQTKISVDQVSEEGLSTVESALLDYIPASVTPALDDQWRETNPGQKEENTGMFGEGNN